MRLIALDVTDLKEKCGLVRTEEHRETVTKIPHADRVPIRVEDRVFVEPRA